MQNIPSACMQQMEKLNPSKLPWVMRISQCIYKTNSHLEGTYVLSSQRPRNIADDCTASPHLAVHIFCNCITVRVEIYDYEKDTYESLVYSYIYVIGYLNELRSQHRLS